MGGNPVNYFDPFGLEINYWSGTENKPSPELNTAIAATAAAASVYIALGPMAPIALTMVELGYLSTGEIPVGKLGSCPLNSGANNIANSSKLANQLRLQSANSPFSKIGGLTQEAIKNSTKIIDSSQIKNTAIPKGFSKYTTETFQSPSGNFQAHFYKNDKTGETFYGQDFKVIFNSMSGNH